MSFRQTIKDEISATETIHLIAGVLMDLSALRLTELRRSFEQNRAFYGEITDLYALVKAQRAGAHEVPKRPRTLAVALTANQRFHGSLNADTIDVFLESFNRAKQGENEEREGLVIGRTGRALLEAAGKSAGFKMLLFQRDMPTPTEMRVLLHMSAAYNYVELYHARFVNVLTQHVTVTRIAEEPVDSSQAWETALPSIFEPELEKLVDFFENEIKRFIFLGALYEAELARTAARMVAMNRAEETAAGRIRRERAALRRATATIQTVNLLEAFTHLKQWKNHLQQAADSL